MRILLIEDEKDLAAPVIEHLKADQNVVDWFETCPTATQLRLVSRMM